MPTNLHDLKSDLVVPAATDGAPAAGRRVRLALPGFESWEVRHTLYLPTDWAPGKSFPVFVEYPGNGGYRNVLGDVSTGRVEDCKLGYGLSAGQGFLWLCLPFVDPKTRRHALQWWGDPDATAKYCRDAVAAVCRDFGGDPARVALTGFSRGALACGYIGLRDDATAKLWRALMPHSHYDGVRRWNYPADDPASARTRWRRFAGKPQFVTHENSIDDVRKFLHGTDAAAIELAALPFPNHSDEWVLKNLPLRTRARQWLAKALASPGARP